MNLTSKTAEQLDLSSTTSVIAQGLFFSDALQATSVVKLLQAGHIDPPDRSRRKSSPISLPKMGAGGK
ncbi:MAG: hypothetical protein U5K38_11675 [Woeseiaceae bacterium]|nr:hypothetical protein [Woeseiaceae bacterium]